MGLTPYGFLHSDTCGSFRACQSPQLFAAYRVLLRLPMPRHSPCALISLTISFMISQIMLVSRLKNYCSIFTSQTSIVYVVDTCFSSLHLLSCFIQFSRFYAFEAFRSFTRGLSLPLASYLLASWWAQVDSNHRPHAYQACALTT